MANKAVKEMTLADIEVEITLIHLKEKVNSEVNANRRLKGQPFDDALLRANDVLFKRLQELVIQRDKRKGVKPGIRG